MPVPDRAGPVRAPPGLPSRLRSVHECLRHQPLIALPTLCLSPSGRRKGAQSVLLQLAWRETPVWVAARRSRRRGCKAGLRRRSHTACPSCPAPADHRKLLQSSASANAQAFAQAAGSGSADAFAQAAATAQAQGESRGNRRAGAVPACPSCQLSPKRDPVQRAAHLSACRPGPGAG